MATCPPYPAYPAPVTRARWWQRPRVRYGALIGLLTLAGAVILALVREQTGTQGFLVGMGLGVLPVPLLISAFRWLDRVDPGPWGNLLFSFAWGACAAALMAIVANSLATRWIATTLADPTGADTLGATVIAPVVEESAKAAAALLVFLFRRRHFTGVVDGIVIAGVTATGFAFTENILYLGTAFGTDELTGDRGVGSLTAATFFVRVIMSPFAHPLFTVLTGIGLGLSARCARRHRVRRALLPPAGLLLAMGMHALWNGSASLGDYGFLAVYAVVMMPAFGLLTWLAIWTRQRELRIVRTELPVYVAAGWLGPAEPYALGSMRARHIARREAHRGAGKAAARTVAEYTAYATSLASLRERGRHGRAGADYAVRERELLAELWNRRQVARPALDHAARVTAPPVRMPPAPPWTPYGPCNSHGSYSAYWTHGAYRAYGAAPYGAHGPYGAHAAYGTPGPYGPPSPHRHP